MATHQPAAYGSLSAETLADIQRFEQFFARRDEGIQDLLGRRLPISKLRNEIIRTVLREFGGGRCHGLSFYQRDLTMFAGRAAIRDEVHRLASVGVLVLEDDPADGRALIIRPSRALVEWCETHVLSLKSEIRRLFSAPPIL